MLVTQLLLLVLVLIPIVFHVLLVNTLILLLIATMVILHKFVLNVLKMSIVQMVEASVKIVILVILLIMQLDKVHASLNRHIVLHLLGLLLVSDECFFLQLQLQLQLPLLFVFSLFTVSDTVNVTNLSIQFNSIPFPPITLLFLLLLLLVFYL